MADICVIYLSEDLTLVRQFVGLLRKDWQVWWSEDIAHGDWEQRVKEEIATARAVVPVLSEHFQGERGDIIRDEMRFAKGLGKPILPFLIGNVDVPLGFGGLNYTQAAGWVGEEGDDGYRQLKSKLSKTVGSPRNSVGGLTRPKQLTVRDKHLALPAFLFSVSSHETQIAPDEGLSLLKYLEPPALLVSAYDVWNYYRADSSFARTVSGIRRSKIVCFLDSGNYEAYRRRDHYTAKRNPKGWRKEHFWKVARRLSPDLAFAFDSVNPKGQPDKIVDDIVRSYRRDNRELRERDFPLCPIVHLPSESLSKECDYAQHIVREVAAELDPLLIAIPERELGDGLMSRVACVRAIRRSLDTLDRYYPLHLLGTGNPLSMVAFATAGADSFDGLEWCRTVVDYDNGYLFHFQQFDCFEQARLTRVKDPKVRSILGDKTTPYAFRALSYNIDYFADMTRTMQDLIRTGQTNVLLRMVPNLATEILEELSV